jgi:hypothetical protein
LRDASDHPSTRVDHDRRGRRKFACAPWFAAPARVLFAPLARLWIAPPARVVGFSPRINHAPRVGRRRNMTVQLASTPMQRCRTGAWETCRRLAQHRDGHPCLYGYGAGVGSQNSPAARERTTLANL